MSEQQQRILETLREITEHLIWLNSYEPKASSNVVLDNALTVLAANGLELDYER